MNTSELKELNIPGGSLVVKVGTCRSVRNTQQLLINSYITLSIVAVWPYSYTQDQLISADDACASVRDVI
jgi:hypothetical protein